MTVRSNFRKFAVFCVFAAFPIFGASSGFGAERTELTESQRYDLGKASELVSVCKIALNESTSYNTAEAKIVFSGTRCGAHLQGFSAGFVIGAADSMPATSGEQRDIIKTKLNRIAYLPVPIGLRELAVAFLDWAKRNPQHISADSGPSLLEAWRSQFPCNH